MSDLSLIFRRTGAQIDEIVLDATLSETHQVEAEITEHPVEEGANITDHVRLRSDVVTIEGIVSNTPIDDEQMARVRAGSGAVTVADSGISGAIGYAESVFERLKELHAARRLITLVTGLRTYDSMIMQSLNVPRDPKTGDMLRFTATFKQVAVVTNKLTVVQIPAGKKKAKLGRQVAKEVKPAAAAKPYESILDGANDYFGDIVGVSR